MAFSLSLFALVYAPSPRWRLSPATVPTPDVLARDRDPRPPLHRGRVRAMLGALIDEIGPVRSTVVTYLNPAVAALLGVAVLREIAHGSDGPSGSGW